MSEQPLPEPIQVLGIPVHPLTRDQLVETIAAWVMVGRVKKVYNVNVHAMNLAHDVPRFRDSLIAADLVFCDGAGVQTAARLLGKSLPERLTPMDWIDDLLSTLVVQGSSVFLLGDEEGVVEAAYAVMRDRHPDLSISGHHHGFFPTTGPENRRIVEMLATLNPSVILVGMGMPVQEFWIDDNLDHLPPAVFIPVGAAFRWYSGVQQRPPAWMRNHGLEWLGRLLMEPRRLGHRYLIGNPRFLGRVITSRVRGTG